MKIFIVTFALLTIGILGACSDASTNPTKKEFPTYKYSFTGKISNPKNITIPDDAYFVGSWIINSGSSNYLYYYGDGFVNKATNTFTIGFNDTLPLEAVNRSSSAPGSFSVGSFVLVTSPTKLSGKDPNGFRITNEAKVWGALNWAGIVYVGADSTTKWNDWTKAFKPGFTFAKGAKNGQNEYYEEANQNEMEVLIDTSMSAFSFPEWTGVNPYKGIIK